jgi:S-adenosylmethionine:tRNA ribosyltransferase-isomerase
MKTSDYSFDLPEHLIATNPNRERSSSRLLYASRQRKDFTNGIFSEIQTLLNPGDLLVLNDTKVKPCRLLAHKKTGAKAHILVVCSLSDQVCHALIQANKPTKIGTIFVLSGTDISWEVTGRHGQFYELTVRDCSLSIEAMLDQYGMMPLPPYMKREAINADHNDYQTVYAAHRGALAAPTAGLHFDRWLIDVLIQKGVKIATLTLHVGLGTFMPVKVEDIHSHVMHKESMVVDDALCHLWQKTRASGGRVIAVGTTSVRALESAYKETKLMKGCELDTELFIYPGYSFNSIDGMITNFHLPKSTLLMLVSAWLGREKLLSLYDHAINHSFRFYSYGDAMLLV